MKRNTGKVSVIKKKNKRHCSLGLALRNTVLACLHGKFSHCSVKLYIIGLMSFCILVKNPALCRRLESDTATRISWMPAVKDCGQAGQ